MSNDFQLTIAPPVLKATTASGGVSINRQTLGWKRSIKLQGGPWIGTFTLDAPDTILLDWFANRLGWHVVERAFGAVTWEGMVYEMELQEDGVTRRRSLDDMRNWVVTAMTGIGYSTVYEQATSQARYGQRQAVLSASVDTTDGNRLAQQYLAENAWPWARPIGILPSDARPTLEVKVCGYVFTLNWRTTNLYETGTSRINVSDRVTAALEWSDEFLTAKTVHLNTYQMLQTYTRKLGTWEYLQELVAFGDANNNPWRIHVVPGRRAVYETVDLTPHYGLRNGQIAQISGGQPSQWTVQPGVFRDLTYSNMRGEPGSFLDDPRDILVEEVEASADGLSLKTGTYTEAEMIQVKATLDEEQRQQEEED